MNVRPFTRRIANAARFVQASTRGLWLLAITLSAFVAGCIIGMGNHDPLAVHYTRELYFGFVSQETFPLLTFILVIFGTFGSLVAVVPAVRYSRNHKDENPA